MAHPLPLYIYPLLPPLAPVLYIPLAESIRNRVRHSEAQPRNLLK